VFSNPISSLRRKGCALRLVNKTGDYVNLLLQLLPTVAACSLFVGLKLGVAGGVSLGEVSQAQLGAILGVALVQQLCR
jgi:hypothetical protein